MKTRQISAWILVGLLAGSGVLTSCSKDDDTADLPPIGGYNSSNEVSASNLVAHWPFDGSNNERISGTAPEAAVNAKFVTGASGQRQALDLASGYVAYPSIAAIGAANSLPSFTVSAWVNVKNRKGNGDPATAFFSLSRPNEWAGSINLMAETGHFTAEKDTLKVKGLLVQNGSRFEDSLNDPTKGGDQAFKGAGKWSHVVITYDGSTSTFQVYANGKKISNPEWEKRGTTGNLVITTPAKAIIGAWATNLPGATAEAWQKPMTGQIDEVRVYNKALSAGDIGSLYQLEQAGR